VLPGEMVEVVQVVKTETNTFLRLADERCVD